MLETHPSYPPFLSARYKYKSIDIRTVKSSAEIHLSPCQTFGHRFQKLKKPVRCGIVVRAPNEDSAHHRVLPSEQPQDSLPGCVAPIEGQRKAVLDVCCLVEFWMHEDSHYPVLKLCQEVQRKLTFRNPKKSMGGKLNNFKYAIKVHTFKEPDAVGVSIPPSDLNP